MYELFDPNDRINHEERAMYERQHREAMREAEDLDAAKEVYYFQRENAAFDARPSFF